MQQEHSPESPRPSRAATRSIVIAIALVAVAALLWINREVLILAFGSIVFATVIRLVATPLFCWTRLPERWSVVIALALLVLFAVGLSWMFGLRVSQQFAQLQQQLPEALSRIEASLNKSDAGRTLTNAAHQLESSGVFSKIGVAAKAAAGVLTNIVLIAFAAVYMALDPRLYSRGLVRLLPPAQRPHVDKALKAAGDALAKWVRAQLLLMLAVGVLTGVGLALVGVPLAFSLAVIIGLLEFIPLIGPVLGAIPGILVAFTVGPQTALYALLVYLVVQQIEGNVLTPLVQRWAVELPPVVALFAVLVCGLTFGLTGVVFATPLAVVIMVLTQRLYVEDALEK